MNVHWFQHVPFEGLGSIADWLQEREARVSRTRFFAGDALPAVEQVDLLVVMGGPMSVNDQERLGWLVPEKQFIGRAVQRGIPVLGVCLGAQLIAAALGARVYPNREKEIGWFPVGPPDPGPPAWAFDFPAGGTVFHWHGETFDLPAGAVHLARSDGCEHQAFQLGKRVMGLQFHLETTPESAGAMVANCQEELVESRFIQAGEQILAAGPERYRSLRIQMDRVLDYLCLR